MSKLDKTFTATLLKMDPKKITRETVSEAIAKIKDFKSDVMCGPWYFGPGDEHNPNHRGSVAVVEKGGFVTKASCFENDDPDLANILKNEKAMHLVD